MPSSSAVASNSPLQARWMRQDRCGRCEEPPIDGARQVGAAMATGREWAVASPAGYAPRSRSRRRRGVRHRAFTSHPTAAGLHSRVRPISAPARLTLACGQLQHAIPTRPLWPTEMAIGQVGTRLDSGRSSDGLSPGKPQVRAPSLPLFAEPSAVSFIASSDVPTPRHRGFRRRFVRPRLDRRSLAGRAVPRCRPDCAPIA